MAFPAFDSHGQTLTAVSILHPARPGLVFVRHGHRKVAVFLYET